MASKTYDAQCAERKVMQTFSTNLIRLRAQKNMTQTYVAGALGHKKQFLSRMESGTTMPSVGGLILLAEFYCVGIDELLFSELSSALPGENGNADITEISEN